MDVLHGVLLNIYGTPVQGNGFTFMPADVALAGDAFSLEFRLCDHLEGRLPPALGIPVKEGIDAAWVRARIPGTFGFTPEPAETEKALLYAGFVAVTEDRSVSYPFVCTDHYGRSALMFSEQGPEEAVKRTIAAAFWDVLAREPDELTDFEERVYHPGAGVWLSYGCELGRVYCDETEE
jgi:hypothetical protein